MERGKHAFPPIKNSSLFLLAAVGADHDCGKKQERRKRESIDVYLSSIRRSKPRQLILLYWEERRKIFLSPPLPLSLSLIESWMLRVEKLCNAPIHSTSGSWRYSALVDLLTEILNERSRFHSESVTAVGARTASLPQTIMHSNAWFSLPSEKCDAYETSLLWMSVPNGTSLHEMSLTFLLLKSIFIVFLWDSLVWYSFNGKNAILKWLNRIVGWDVSMVSPMLSDSF